MNSKLRDEQFERESTDASKKFAQRVIPKYDEACEAALERLVTEAYRSGFKHGVRSGWRRGLEVGKSEALEKCST